MHEQRFQLPLIC